jgi:hypothetical protein
MSPELQEIRDGLDRAFHRQLAASTSAAKAGDHDRALRERDVAAGFAASVLFVEAVGAQPHRFRVMEVVAAASLPIYTVDMAAHHSWGYFAFGMVCVVMQSWFLREKLKGAGR